MHDHADHPHHNEHNTNQADGHRDNSRGDLEARDTSPRTAASDDDMAGIPKLSETGPDQPVWYSDQSRNAVGTAGIPGTSITFTARLPTDSAANWPQRSPIFWTGQPATNPNPVPVPARHVGCAGVEAVGHGGVPVEVAVRVVGS